MGSHAATLLAAANHHATDLARIGVDANRALIHLGNGEYLRERLWSRCLEAGASTSSDTKRTLVVVATGGSMTHGSMNCFSGEHILCAGPYLQERRAWPSLLRQHLQSVLPGCKVDLRRAINPATMITQIFRDISRVALPDADLVIEDYTVNDQRGKTIIGGRVNDSSALQHILGGHEFLAMRLRAQRTPLIMTEAFPDLKPPLRCQADSDYGHAAIAKAYALPVVSFMRAVCNESATADASLWPGPQQHWRAGCGTLDEAGDKCMPHPGPHTHSIYAALLAVYLLRQAAASAAFYDPARRTAARLHELDRMRAQEPPASSATGPIVLSPSELEQLRGCGWSETLTSVDATQNCALRTKLGSRRHVDKETGSAPGWSCYEDRPGKPGWIANATRDRTPRTLTVTMRGTYAGHLVIGFLRSYEGMGSASVYIDGNKSMAFTLDGHWDEGTSQTQYASIPLVKLVHAPLGTVHHPSLHSVHVQVPSIEEEAAVDSSNPVGKFKVVSLGTC